MKPGNQVWLIAFLLIALGAFPLRAAVLTNNLSFALTCVRHKDSTNNATTETETVVKFRGSQKGIIQLIGLATTTSFPDNSRLQLVLSDANSTNAPLFLVTDKSGTVLADVSRFFAISFGGAGARGGAGAAAGAAAGGGGEGLR